MNRTLAGRPPATLIMLCACLAWVFVIPPTAHALDPDKRLTQYLHRSFRMPDGSAPESMFNHHANDDVFCGCHRFASSIDSTVFALFDGICPRRAAWRPTS